jgi:hypothetical protein
MTSSRKKNKPFWGFLVLCVFLASCTSQHPAVGTWKGKLLVLAVHPDQVAIVNGLKCHWVEIDPMTIRIEAPPLPGANGFIQILGSVAAELRVHQESGGGRIALLSLPGVPGAEWRLEPQHSIRSSL